MFATKTLITFGFLILLLNGCKGNELIEMDFESLENKATVFAEELNVFIQYGVDKDGKVRYVVISKDLSSAALIIERKLTEIGKRSAIARVQTENSELPPPTPSENLVYCDKFGVFRGKLKVSSELDLKREIKSLKEASRESFFKVLSNNTTVKK